MPSNPFKILTPMNTDTHRKLDNGDLEASGCSIADKEWRIQQLEEMLVAAETSGDEQAAARLKRQINRENSGHYERRHSRPAPTPVTVIVNVEVPGVEVHVSRTRLEPDADQVHSSIPNGNTHE